MVARFRGIQLDRRDTKNFGGSAPFNGNFASLLVRVTRSPQMGHYLDMINNAKANPTKGTEPNENFARELLQLFSIGTVELKDDGTPLTDAKGVPVPTYGQSEVKAFARVFTGWTYPEFDAAQVKGGSDKRFYAKPMVANEARHDTGAKTLLHGTVVPAGQGTEADLGAAMNNVFVHPNVGPFFAQHMIRQLVTSNPSPAYVARVSHVFNDDGLGVRGNLGAVVRAILLDPEARIGQFHSPTTFGKLREPLLRITHLWRAMGATHVCGTTNATQHYANLYRYAGYTTAYSVGSALYSGVGQAALRADTVFNFFKPSYVPSGEMAGLGLVGPEYQITTDTLISNSTNTLFEDTYDINLDVAGACGGSDSGYGNVKINRAQDQALAGSASGGVADPADLLVDAYDVRFMSGQMSPAMRQTLLTALNPVSAATFDTNKYPNWQFERISKALQLILTSPEYMVQK